jgi:outer membrane protein OmpA-like peptidoglycan-associated protein
MSTLRLIMSGLFLISLGAGGAGAQIGGLIKKKATEVVKDAAKAPAKDTTRTPAQPGAKAPAPAATPAPSTAPPATTPAAAAPAPASQQGAPAAKTDPKIWENYDFIPGTRVIFYTDFSEDRVGNFARGLKYVSGPAEIVERDSVKVLRSTGRSNMYIPVGSKVPERFTLEVDVITSNLLMNDQLVFEGGRQLDRGDKSAEVTWSPRGTFIIGGGQNAGVSAKNLPADVQKQISGNVTHIRVLMDGPYFKMYMNERRLYNIPELQFRRDPDLRLMIGGTEESPVYVTGIRLAESETDVLYDALSTKGRWATQGILFATGKAELRPESRAVLKEIAATLKQHGDLKILIEGHTDNVGAAAANLTLSDARAAAVKASLVVEYGVSADRLTTKGLGDTKPSVPNTTAAGRAQNRRVEIVKQ